MSKPDPGSDASTDEEREIEEAAPALADAAAALADAADNSHVRYRHD